MSTAFRSSPDRVFALQALPRAVRSIALGATLAAPVGIALYSGSAFAEEAAKTDNASALQLDATNVDGQRLGLTTENTGSYTTGATSTATKLPLSLRDTPQSVTVITRQFMDDQNVNTIYEALSLIPGISGNHRDSDRFTLYSRGFQIQNFMYDGIPSQVANESQQFVSTLQDLAIYDRLEVVRGATGLMSGAGTPSATINLVRKRPTQEFQGYVSGEAGAWDKYRTEADVSGPLNSEGTVRGRVVGAYEKANSFVDWYKTEKKVLYGALDIDLSEDTLLRFNLGYQNNDSNGASFGHMPLFNSDGSQTHFSRSFNPAARWSYMNNTGYDFTTMLEHKLANDWSLKAAYTHQYSYRRATVGSASAGTVGPDGSGVSMFVNRLDSYQDQDTLDVYATGPFNLGGREHQLVVGASTSHTHLNYPTYDRFSPLVSVPDINNWNGDEIGKPHLGKVGENVTTLTQTGFYATANFKPFDPLSIIVGARLSNWKQEDFSSNFATDTNAYNESTDNTKKTGVVTPYAGIIYDINDNFSVYASYTNIFLPQTFYKTASGSSLDPLEGDNYEIGLKGEFFGGALNTSIALFDVEQKNTPELLPDNGSGREAYRAISGTSTKGVETEISGEVSEGWNVLGGYTYRESHDKDGKRVDANQAMNLFKLGTSYRLPGAWNRLTVGGNVIWQSEIYAFNENFGTKAKQDPFAVVGLLANYKVDDHLSVGANFNNVFDKKYYDGLGTFSSGSYGEPRNLMFNAKWKF